MSVGASSDSVVALKKFFNHEVRRKSFLQTPLRSKITPQDVFIFFFFFFSKCPRQINHGLFFVTWDYCNATYWYITIVNSIRQIGRREPSNNQNFQYSILAAALSNGNSPPQELTSARLSFTAHRKSFLASRANVKSMTPPPSISSFELWEVDR